MQLRDVAPSFMVSIIMAIPVYCLSFLTISYYILLPIQILVGAVVAYLLFELLKQEEYLLLKGVLKENVARIINRFK